MEKFLAVNKEYLGIGLQPIDILILAQIQEYERSNECYASNQTFADSFGVSTKTVERALDRLEKLKYIDRDTKVVSDNGQKSKKRKIKTKKATVKMTVGYEKQPSNCPEATVNLSKSNRQNDGRKDNLKDNLKEKLSKREKERDLEDLTDEELESIISDYSKKVSYKATRERLNLNRQVTKDTHKEVESILAQRAAKARYKETVDTLGFDLDSNVTLDMAYHFATEILKFKVSKEEMQDDMNIHAKYGQPYTWNDFVNPPKPINRSSFYDYTAGLCSMLN